MAISRVSIPTPSAPVAVSDYVAQNDQLAAMVQAFTGRSIVDGSTIHAGTAMMIGGVLYKATSDTAISGTSSDYVKITKSGDALTATASFVSSLAGVSWNHVYGQYQDSSGNMYLFDEAKAIYVGAISTAYTMQGQISVVTSLLVKNGVGIGGVLSVTGATELTGGLHSGSDVDAEGNIYGASLEVVGSIEGASLSVPGTVAFLSTEVSHSSSGDLSHMELFERRKVNVTSGANKYVYAPGEAGTMYLAYYDGGAAGVFRDGNQICYVNGVAVYVVRVR